MKKLILMLLIIGCLFTSHAKVYKTFEVIEDFDNPADPANWREISADPVTRNATNAAAPSSYEDRFMPDAAAVHAGRFEFNWVLPGVTGPVTNCVVSGSSADPFWTMRIDVGNPGGLALPSFPIERLNADFYNNNDYPVQVALYVSDGEGTSYFERGPLVTLAPHAFTAYDWIMRDPLPVGYITGNGVWDNNTVNFRGIVVYTETAPTSSAFSMDVICIRLLYPQPTCRCLPPDAILYSATQGSAPGKLKIEWKEQTYPLLGGGYKIYLATDENFGSPDLNRLAFPETPVATAPADATSVEIDVPTDKPVYIALEAYDDSFTNPGIRVILPALGAWLKTDGTPPNDLVVLDLTHFNTEESFGAINNGYFHRIVYNAQALLDLNRPFQSCTSQAIADGKVALEPNIGVVIYSNGQDGEVYSGQTISDSVISALTTFVNTGGNLFITGTSLGEDLQTNGTAAGKAFYANILKAGLSFAENVDADGIIPEAPFESAGNFATGADIWNVAACGLKDNEGVTAGSGGTAVLTYDEAGNRKAGVIWGNRVVYFAFSHETVQDKTNVTFAAARAKRAALLGDVIQYLTWAPSRCEDWEIYK